MGYYIVYWGSKKQLYGILRLYRDIGKQNESYDLRFMEVFLYPACSGNFLERGMHGRVEYVKSGQAHDLRLTYE